MVHEVDKDSLAGFELIGYRQADGTILLGNKVPMNNFPKEVEILGAAYSLEDVKLNDEDDTLPADHEGKFIEWGIYV